MTETFIKQFQSPIWVKDDKEMEAVIINAETWWIAHKPREEELHDWMQKRPKLTFKTKK